jgi:hypothetical protein
MSNDKIPGGGENVSLGSDLRTQLYRYLADTRRVKNQVLKEAIEDLLTKYGFWPIGN